MIGAVVFELSAENGERVSDAQGRLLHGALFSLIDAVSPGLAALLHDGTTVKPFSVAPLDLPPDAPKVGRDRLVRAGDVVYWRVAALDEAVLRALLSVPPGSVVQVGRLRLALRRIVADSGERPDVGVIDEMELIGACLAEKSVRSVEFRFLTPVAFRVDDSDYPLPAPALVFSSLADKWTAAELPAAIDRNEIRADAERIYPASWRGETRRVTFGRNRSVTGFVGRFAYDLSALPIEVRQVFLLLAQFAVFSGVGRLTGQGLGQTRTTYR